MMRKTTVVAIFFLLTSTLYAQVTNSVLANGNWYKFSVDTTGVFRIDRSLLQQIGVSTTGLDPRKIHIYGNGGNRLSELNSDFRHEDLQENAIYIEGEADGSFDANDFILFYAQGPHHWVTNPASGTASHRQNIYSDKAYYFITVDGTNGKRVQPSTPVTGTPDIQATTFDDFVFYEQETVNLFAAGRKWLGEEFSIENQQTFEIPFPNAVANQDVSITVRAVGVSALPTSNMRVSVNSQDLYTLSFLAINPNSLILASDQIRTGTLMNSSSTFNITIDYNNGGNPAARAYLDYIEVVGKKNLVADNFQFSFRSFDAANATGIVEYQIQNAQNILQLWDVTDPINVASIENESTGNFTFKANAGELREYVVLNSGDFYTPETVAGSRVENQNLHALQDINYLLITNEELSSQAQRIADYHQQNSGLTTQVVIVDDIYNEFSSGAPDITGIRDFIKHIYDNNTTADKKLRYVCFFGDGSYDYKDRITENNNIVPVYESEQSYSLAFSYVTDDFFVMLDDNEGSMSPTHTLDVATGRIPVSTLSQATQVVDKILNYYETDGLGDWRNVVTLVADDTDEPTDNSIQIGVERIADDIKNNKPVFNVNKIYADAFVQENSSGGERYPDVKEAITTAIERGTLVFDYFGHGGEDGFASERFLDVPQVQAFQNSNTLPLFITVTCEFSRFDNPSRITAGELTFWNTNGGAASMITTTREVFVSVGQNFNEDLISILLEFTPNNFSIAEALTETKNGFSNFQKFFIYYFGDPAKELAIPEPNVRITRMNGVDVTQSLDTLKALSKVSFEGVVTDNANNTLSDFNGTLSTTVFDKPIDKSTLDNDGFNNVMIFDSQESKLFRGQATVENGAFSFEFIVPRDIRIAFGKGKLSFYAENQVSDRGGFNNDVIVGGINESAPEDTTGPEIQLFMNDESFIDGGNTNVSPNLIAKLSDISGINTSVTAVDHDIVAILDGDESNPIILNDFYQTELDDFTNGKVVYRLRDLSVGPHTIKLKAWDTYNNSSEATINFVVVSDATLTLDNVLNYPNPFVNYTEFWFNHNKPNESLEVQVQIFTISGKLIKTINQQVLTTGNLSRSIAWNGLDDFGNRIGKGVYVYKLKVKSTVSNISAEKYEKLVIL
ncbi:type IX secretion system sortase PorU [Pseudotenacibaculum haliotis]|uniref:Type IX secretion system sortase PorU n=1 Tax=Pseudotenacibaculum haliotis TaxID=1862138 RepID=A0ABW5LV46_9FLAO